MRFWLIGLAGIASLANAGPIGFVFDGDSTTGYSVDLATGIGTPFPTFFRGYPVSIVDNKIRLGDVDDGPVHEYNLNGSPTGATFSGSGIFSELLDGTTDGVHNYAVQCCAAEPNHVVTTDLFWQGSSVLFNLPDEGSGIAYDTLTGTLFVSLYDGTVHQYSLAGVDLGSFSIGFQSRGLAYDKASDTLWALFLDDGQAFRQYSTAGAQVGSVATSGFNNPYGFEIDNGIVSSAVPEPGTFGMLGAAIALLAAHRRAKK